MRVDFAQPLKTMDGVPIKDDEGKRDEAGKPVEDFTLKVLCVRVLVATLSGDDKLPGEKKLKLYDLACSINTGTADLESDDIVLVKERISKAFGPLVVGQAFKMLEGQPLKLVK